MKRGFGRNLTEEQWGIARKLEAKGIMTISQAVKCFEKGNTKEINERIREYKQNHPEEYK